MGISQFFRHAVSLMAPYPLAKSVDAPIKLMSNENNFGPSPRVIAALRDVTAHRYPDPLSKELREAYAHHLSRDAGRAIPDSWVVAFSGGDDAIRTTLGIFCEPHVDVVTYSPTFAMYEIGVQFYGAQWRATPLTPDFQYTDTVFENMYQSLSPHTRLIVIVNPNNPTGTSIPRRYIEKFLDTGIPTIVDEAYREFSGDTVVDLVPDFPNLIIVRSLSKAYALAGLRIGFVINSDSSFIDALLKTKLVFNVSRAAQVAGIAALSDEDYVRTHVRKIIEERERVRAALSRVTTVFPSKANFLLIDTKPLSSEEFVHRLIDHGILTRGFPPHFCRITIGLPEENDALISAVHKIFAEIHR